MTSSPLWAVKRLDAFVSNFGCHYIDVTVDGVTTTFVVCSNVWVPELIDCISHGGCPNGTPTCRQAIGYPPP